MYHVQVIASMSNLCFDSLHLTIPIVYKHPGALRLIISIDEFA